MRRASLIPIILGLILGFSAGLYYSWVVNPVEYVDADPASLRSDYKQEALTVIAGAYAATGDLPRARARLALLDLDNPANTLARLAQSMLAVDQDERAARELAQLAADLGPRPVSVDDTPLATATVTLAPEASATASPTATITPRPTATATVAPSATPGAPFELGEQEQICDPALGEPQIQVVVLDAAGEGVPGMELLVLWDEGEDRFFTGLKPELGWGYADFSMQVGEIYSLELPSEDIGVSELVSEPCETAGGVEYPGSIRLTFEQPLKP
ncbi:MAG: hypothetical protein PVH92_05425 [Anaerolineales bacterium]|jgi:hypothetical protein